MFRIRFVKEFELQKEALAIQSSVNGVIRDVNDFLYPDKKKKKGSNNNNNNDDNGADQTGGLLGTVLSIPQVEIWI